MLAGVVFLVGDAVEPDGLGIVFDALDEGELGHEIIGCGAVPVFLVRGQYLRDGFRISEVLFRRPAFVGNLRKSAA